MFALKCDWGGDLEVGSGGDIGVASIEDSLQQRVIRRLLTNLGDYIWHTEYGAGVGSYVGMPYSPGLIEGLILNQLHYEDYIAGSPPPTVQVDQSVANSASAASVIVCYRASGAPGGGSVVLGLDA